MIVRLKSFLWIVTVLAIALAFPMQVYVGNPLPSLIPYAFLSILVLISTIQGIQSHRSWVIQLNNIDFSATAFFLRLL